MLVVCVDIAKQQEWALGLIIWRLKEGKIVAFSWEKSLINI